MKTTTSPRAVGRGNREGELRPGPLVQVRSLDGKRHFADISEEQAAELLRRHICCEKFAGNGRRKYLRLLISEDDLPKASSVASLKTVRHVKGPSTIRSERGADYFEHRFPNSVAITEGTRRKAQKG
jgi:hypothetical protein